MTNITGDTRLYAILADPVHHVQTPQSMNRLFAQRGTNAVLVPIHVDAEHLAAAVAGLRAMRNLDGFVVTVPHKSAIVDLCDELTPAAAQALIARVAGSYPGLSLALGSDDPSGHDLVVNGTSLGLRAGDAAPCDVSRLEPAQIVAEIIMQPAETPLLSAALAKGCRIHYGAPMLACQIELMAAFIAGDGEVRV